MFLLFFDAMRWYQPPLMGRDKRSSLAGLYTAVPAHSWPGMEKARDQNRGLWCNSRNRRDKNSKPVPR